MTLASEKTSALLGPEDGRPIRFGPFELLVKEDGSATRENVAVAEFRAKGPFKIPPHLHTEHDEVIHVLEGSLDVMMGDETFTATAGTSFTTPIGVVHGVSSEGGPVRFLNIIAPAKYLSFFEELAAAGQGAMPAPEQIMQVMQKYGLQPVR